MGRKNGTKNGNTETFSRDKLKQISNLDWYILLLILRGINRNKDFHEHLPEKNGKKNPKSTISRHTTKLKKMGLIKHQIVMNERPFKLTQKGKDLISIFFKEGGGDVTLTNPIRAHNMLFKLPIVRESPDLRKRLREDRWVEYKPRNWVAYQTDRYGCQVVFTTQSVLLRPPEVYGPTPAHCILHYLNLIQRMKESLEGEYPRLVLGSPERVAGIASQSYAFILHPIALKYCESGMTYKSDRLVIDSSKGIPELETVHNVYAFDDMQKIVGFFEAMIRSDLNIEDFNRLINIRKEDDIRIDRLYRKLEKIKRFIGIKEVNASSSLKAIFAVR